MISGQKNESAINEPRIKYVLKISIKSWFSIQIMIFFSNLFVSSFVLGKHIFQSLGHFENEWRIWYGLLH